MKRRLSALALAAALSACTLPTNADLVSKINYVCAYSGLFKFADTAALSVVPAGGLISTAVNAGVTQLCLHPELVARGEADVVALISHFKSLGRM